MRLPAAWRPIVPWAVAAVLCAPLALSVLVFSLLVEPNTVLPPEFGGYAELLDREFAPPPEDASEDAKALRGIVFATSGLSCAITGPKRLPGERIDLLVLPEVAANLLHFRHVIDPAIAARPDFVVVQSALLVTTTWKSLPNAAYAARSFWSRRALALMPRLVRVGPPNPRGRRWSRFSCHPNTLPIRHWKDNLKRRMGQIMPLVDRRRDQTRAILLRFAEAGIPVLVVTPPVNELTEAYHARVNEEARSIVGPAAGAAAISFLEPPTLWPSAQFIDPVHIKPNRAESYRIWLSAAIVAALGN